MKQKLLTVLISILFLLLLSGCVVNSTPADNGSNGSGIAITIPTATLTSTVTPSPTVCPPIDLPSLPEATPERQDTLYIVLFDPTEAQFINLSDNETVPVYEAILQLLQSVMKGGDRFAIFQMGCRYYDFSCRMVNSALPTPLPIDVLVPPSPTPRPSLTPIPTATVPGNSSLFKETQIARVSTQTATAVAPTSTAIAVENACAVSQWAIVYGETAQQIVSTQAARETQIANSVATKMANGTLQESTPTPYAHDVVFDGLAHASQILRNERGNFDRYVVFIFDTMEDWRLNIEAGQVSALSFADMIDLSQAQVFMIMPDCQEVYDPPRCETRTRAWQPILAGDFDALSAEAIPNSQVLESLLTYLSFGQEDR